MTDHANDMDYSESLVFDPENPSQWFTMIADQKDFHLDLELVKKTILENVNSISRMTRNQFVNNITNINLIKDELKELRNSIFNQLNSIIPNTFMLKSRTALKPMAEDIYDMIKMISNKKLVETDDIFNIFTMKPKDKNEEYICYSLEELKQLMSDLKEENKILKNVINDQQTQISNILKIVTNTDEILSRVKLNYNMTYSSILQNDNNSRNMSNPPTTPNAQYNNNNNNKLNTTGNQQASKRPHQKSPNPTIDSNQNLNLVNRDNINKKQKLFQFDSTNPDSLSQPLDESNNQNSWKTVPHNRKSKNNNLNHETPNLNRQSITTKGSTTTPKPNSRNDNNNHQRKHRWQKQIGSNTEIAFPVVPKPYPVYLGRAQNSTTVDDVKNLLKQLKINFWDLKQIQTLHNNFKSYSFNISQSDRHLIEDDNIWPKGIVRNRLRIKRSKANQETNQSNPSTLPSTKTTSTNSSNSTTITTNSSQSVFNPLQMSKNSTSTLSGIGNLSSTITQSSQSCQVIQ